VLSFSIFIGAPFGEFLFTLPLPTSGRIRPQDLATSFPFPFFKKALRCCYFPFRSTYHFLNSSTFPPQDPPEFLDNFRSVGRVSAFFFSKPLESPFFSTAFALPPFPCRVRAVNCPLIGLLATPPSPSIKLFRPSGNGS